MRDLHAQVHGGGTQQEFNSLDAQREASEAFIVSQKHEGRQVITDHFDDGGYTGGNMDRPALKRLLAAVEARSVNCIVVYKVDRLSEISLCEILLTRFIFGLTERRKARSLPSRTLREP